jgi:hypothetical protein
VLISGQVRMSLALSSTTVLGKRKATRYVLHISSLPQRKPVILARIPGAQSPTQKLVG